jgi:hypothetical protein
MTKPGFTTNKVEENLSSPVAKKFKTQRSAGKSMLITFWESQGRILEDYLERQTKMQPIVTRF